MSPVTSRSDVASDVALDTVVPFQVEALDARGRAVLLGPTLDTILSRHDYPEPVARLLAEMTVLTVLLGTSLKFSGKFILQTQTDGPVSLLVVDLVTPDKVRAYARFDETAVDAAVQAGAVSSEEMLGKGTLVLTIDQGQYMNRYQGIVQLDGSSLEEVAHNYFRQSEQIPTQVRLAVGTVTEPAGMDGVRHSWRAGGLLAQFLPESEERMKTGDLSPGEVPDGFVLDEPDLDDAWTEIMALVGTVDADELLDEKIGAERLLFRLFHERGVRVFDGTPVKQECSCSEEKVENVIRSMTKEERDEAVEDGRISVKCEFCSASYVFDPAQFDRQRAN
ncbi:MAG: Hsp33 family molecular chaperone [Pseudomonadota bacterium]